MKLFRILFISSLIVLTVQVHSQVIVKIKPLTPKVVEIRNERPGPKHVWIDGQWRVGPNNNYVWTPGQWVKAKHGHVWVQGHWDRVKDGWCWIPGYWIKKQGDYRRG
jgi:WXXGXW repeat (2 copies)